MHAVMQGLTVTTVPTGPIEGQKTGTSGLRKKTKTFMGENYLANWCGSLHLLSEKHTSHYT